MVWFNITNKMKKGKIFSAKKVSCMYETIALYG